MKVGTMKQPGRTASVLAAICTVVGAIGGALVVAQHADAIPTGSVVQYDSTINPLPGNLPSIGAQSEHFNEFGNEVTLAPSSLAVGQVTVTMSSQACETGGGVTCVTTPGTTFPETFTLNLYNVDPLHTLGTLITTLTQTVNIPFRPSADLVNCTGGNAGRWFDSAGVCDTGLATNVVFDLSAANVVLPTHLIYGIGYDTSTFGPNPTGVPGPADSLNLALSQDPTNVSVGSDPNPGTVFQNSPDAGFYCDSGAAGVGTFRLDSPTVACWGVSSPAVAPYYVPAVQISTVAPPPVPTVPGAPTLVSATAGNASVTLTWTPPTSDGGSAITGYNVFVGTASGGESSTPANGSTLVSGNMFTVTGLTNGTPYFFTVKAVNSVGSSSASNEVSATPVSPAPSVTSVSPTTGPAAGGTSVTITGTNLTGATSVRFGATSATSFAVGSATSITAVAPAGSGTVDVTVTTPVGTSATSAADQFTYTQAPPPPPPPPPPPIATSGYWLVASDGGIFSFGNAGFFGSTGNIHLNQRIVGMASTPDNRGYWLVAADGGIFAFGDAGFFGSTGAIHLNKPIVGMASTPSGRGYWLVASDGGIFAFGDAGFFGSTGAIHLNQPVVGMVSTPNGMGYWMVAADGGIFAFGNAHFFGSMGGTHLNQPIVGMDFAPAGSGYWLVAADGGIFAFGDAGFFGSTGNIHLNQPVVGMTSTEDGQGYWFVAADGGIFAFGDAPFDGSMGGTHLNQPIVGMAAT